MKTTKVKLGTCVTVYWMDSNFVKGWFQGHEETALLPIVKTIGWVTMCTDALLEIASTQVIDGAKLNPLAIPKGAILKMEKVKL